MPKRNAISYHKFFFPILNALDSLKRLVFLIKLLPNGETVIQKMMERMTVFNDVVMGLDAMEAIVEDIQSLLNDCFTLLESLDENSFKPLLIQRGISWDHLYQLVETFVMEHTYEIVFFRITAFHKKGDMDIIDIVTNATHLDLVQFGIPTEFGQNLYNASKVTYGFKNILFLLCQSDYCSLF